MEVRLGDEAIALRAGKQRVVLATLLLRANQTVTIDELIDRLWRDDVPQNARGTVQKYVMRLRRHLGRHGFGGDGTQTGIHTQPGGYRLELHPGQSDLEAFRSLIDDAARAATDGDTAAEADRLRDALALWRGVPPLADVPSDAIRQQDVPQLVEQYLQALEWRIAADLALGRHSELAGELVGLIRTYPLRERFWAQWMRALYRAGRQAEALEAYREVKGLLADELGVDPGAELHSAHQEVLNGEAVDGTAATSRNAPEPEQVCHPAQLPMTASTFVGRHAEIARVTRALLVRRRGGPPPLIVITGPPGVGKTALAVHVAHQVAEHFDDGQLFIDLRGHASGEPVSVTEALGRFLGGMGMLTTPLDVDDQILAYRSRLAGRNVLIVLDNVGRADQVRALLPGESGCAVIVTSRNELAGLVVSPGATRINLPMLSAAEGHTLMNEILADERVIADRAGTTELVALCGGLALALRIAAAQLALRPMLGIGAYLAALRTEDRIPALRIDGDDIASIEATFSWSYRQLSKENRRMLRLLGLVPGRDFTTATAAALADVTAGQAAASLEELAANSLLERVGQWRYNLHDLTQAYAAGRCRAEEPALLREKARRRLFDHYIREVDSAVQAHISLSRLDRPRAEPAADRELAMSRLDDDRAAVVAAVRDAAKHGPPDAAYHLADALRGYFTLRGHTADWLTTVEAGLTAARQAGADEAIAAMLNSRGVLAFYLGDNEQARDAFAAALDIY
ncbi:MAG: AAA family ATPase, partial [Pseudonocardiaceae bacterium]|nr:AAA family ATPase [Pseudonocardiaceae bacterium]